MTLEPLQTLTGSKFSLSEPAYNVLTFASTLIALLSGLILEAYTSEAILPYC